MLSSLYCSCSSRGRGSADAESRRIPCPGKIQGWGAWYFFFFVISYLFSVTKIFVVTRVLSLEVISLLDVDLLFRKEYLLIYSEIEIQSKWDQAKPRGANQPDSGLSVLFTISIVHLPTSLCSLSYNGRFPYTSPASMAMGLLIEYIPIYLTKKPGRAQLLITCTVGLNRRLFIYLLDLLSCRKQLNIYIHIYTFPQPSWWASLAPPLPVLYTRPGVIQFNGWKNIPGLAKLPIAGSIVLFTW